MDRSEEIATQALRALRLSGIDLDRGLSEAELVVAERSVGAVFPPDLRALLARALPTGRSFPNWRDLDEGGPRSFESLIDGVLFDIEHNGFWHGAWPSRVDDLDDLESAKAFARRQLLLAPPLIPIYSHRFLPSAPHAAGNPVLSVHQTDVIIYGANLAEYVRNEFERGWTPPGETTPLPFWGDFVVDDD